MNTPNREDAERAEAAAAAAQAQVEAEQRIVDQVKATHPGFELKRLRDLDNDVVVIVKIDQAEWERFRANLNDENLSNQAVKSFVMNVVVHPPKPEFAAILARRPGVAESLCKPLIKLHGAAAAVSVEKI